VVVALMLAIGGAVALHHASPEMPGMTAGVTCLAVFAAGVAVAAVAGRIVRHALPRPVGLPLPVQLDVAGPLQVPARASPLYLTLLVLRN